MISQSDNDFLRLLLRSPDRGDGWRTVSSIYWPLVESFGSKELLEIDTVGHRVRLTETGIIAAEYTL